MALVGEWLLNGTGEDSVGSADLTVSGTDTTYVTGHDGQGLQVNTGDLSGGGATQVLTNPTAAASLTGWVRPNTSSTDREYPLLGFWTDSDPNNSSQFCIWASRTAFGTPSVLQANLRIGGTLRALNAPSMLSQAQHHVAVTFDGTTARLYVDGSEAASGSWSGTLTAGSLAIGRGAVAINDTVRLWDHALSAGEVTADMGGGATRVTKTVATAWNVRARVVDTQATAWDVRSRATLARTTAWNILSRAAATVATAWNVRRRAVRTVATAWTVESDLVITAPELPLTLSIDGPGLTLTIDGPGLTLEVS